LSPGGLRVADGFVTPLEGFLSTKGIIPTGLHLRKEYFEKRTIALHGCIVAP
jgi:hypothetical protein